MHNIVDNLISIKKEIQSNNSKAEIVAVSKTFPLSKILPLINFGHIHYGENKIQEAINLLTKDRTTLVIAHRLSTIMNSKKIYVVDEGKIIAQGTHQELLQKSETYKNFYEKQLRKD